MIPKKYIKMLIVILSLNGRALTFLIFSKFSAMSMYYFYNQKYNKSGLPWWRSG